MSDHARNTGPMLASPRCGAKTRSGGACRSPAVSGRKRCRMHGGAQGSGAPKANQNARTHGLFTRDAIAERREVQALLRECAEVAGGDEVIGLHRELRKGREVDRHEDGQGNPAAGSHRRAGGGEYG